MQPSGPDQVWASIKELARRYASMAHPPAADVIDRELDAVISMHLGRSVDGRLMAFYRRELEELVGLYRNQK